MAELWREYATREDAYAVSVRVEDNGVGAIWVSRVENDDTFDKFALQFGEMLYQVRAALDSCVYEAAIIETARNPPPDEINLAFPICESKAEFIKKTSRNLRPISQKRRGIIESVQPYKIPHLAPDEMVFNFNRALRILNDWGRKDRHRRLHVVGSWISNASPKVRCPPGTSLDFIHVTPSGLLENESRIASFRLNGYEPDMRVQANPDLYIDVAISEVPSPEADNDTLGNRGLAMLRAARWVVDAIEDSFRRVG